MAHDLWGDRQDALDAPWHALTPDIATLLQASLVQKYAPATVRRAMAALRGIINEVWRQGAMTSEQKDRILDLAPVRGSRPPAGRALTIPEIQALYRHCQARDRGILAGLLWGGLRRSELRTACIEERRADTICLRIQGKGDKVRFVWLHGLPARDFCGVGLTSSGVWKAMTRLGRIAGIPHFSPHDLRRTYASLSLANGVDLALVQRAMGHADPRTTSRYDRRPEEAQAEAARGLARIARTVYPTEES